MTQCVSSHLFLQVVRSILVVHVSRVSLEVPVLPETLEIPLSRALLEVLALYGWRPVDWVPGSGWSCSAPCGLKTGRGMKFKRLDQTGSICG